MSTATCPNCSDASRLEQAVRFVIEKFEADERQGYHTRDRQFAIEILRKALDSPVR